MRAQTAAWTSEVWLLLDVTPGSIFRNLYMVLILGLCFVYGSQNKEQLVTYTLSGFL